MKKILIIILILISYTHKVSGENYFEIPVTLLIEPTYSIKVPKRVDITSSSTLLSFYIKADIFLDQQLIIDFDDNVNIASSKDIVSININPSTFLFNANDLNNNYDCKTINLTHGSLSSGNYLGLLNFTISLRGE